MLAWLVLSPQADNRRQLIINVRILTPAKEANAVRKKRELRGSLRAQAAHHAVAERRRGAHRAVAPGEIEQRARVAGPRALEEAREHFDGARHLEQALEKTE